MGTAFQYSRVCPRDAWSSSPGRGTAAPSRAPPRPAPGPGLRASPHRSALTRPPEHREKGEFRGVPRAQKLSAEGEERFGTGRDPRCSGGRAPGGMECADFCFLRPGSRRAAGTGPGWRLQKRWRKKQKQQELMTLRLKPASPFPEQAESRANPIRIHHVRPQSSPAIPARRKKIHLLGSLFDFLTYL